MGEGLQEEGTVVRSRGFSRQVVDRHYPHKKTQIVECSVGINGDLISLSQLLRLPVFGAGVGKVKTDNSQCLT